jgi:hypothetical protein
MSELTIGERHDLIAELTREAIPNPTHLCIAQLIRDGFVQRVLTTNFDDLLPRACAQLAVRAFVHDFSTVEQYDPSLAREPAIFYLHGRDGGMVQHHTDDAMRRHSDQLARVIGDCVVGRPFIVVGYSGQSDPVFDSLASVSRYTYGLYWVTYRRQPPDLHVAKGLLRPDKYAYFVPASDADEFFQDLCRHLATFEASQGAPAIAQSNVRSPNDSDDFMPTARCAHCGARVSSRLDACKSCAKPHRAVCARCGALLYRDFAFCGKCGGRAWD